MPWKLNTPMQRHQALENRLKAKVIGRRIWNGAKEYDGRPADVRSVTGKEPITDEQDD